MTSTAATLSRRQESHIERRDVTINVRATSQWRSLIDHAATLIGKSRSEFLLESGRRYAEDVLLDQALFRLDERRYRDFMALLDEPIPPTEELRRLMTSKAPWEK